MTDTLGRFSRDPTGPATYAASVSADDALDLDTPTLLLVNKSRKGLSVSLPAGRSPTAIYGFDAAHPAASALTAPGGTTLALPARSARLVIMA